MENRLMDTGGEGGRGGEDGTNGKSSLETGTRCTWNIQSVGVC